MNFDLRNAVVALTGAASGIGAELAVQLGHAGAHLALIDRDADGLAATRLRLGPAVQASCHVIDLSDKQAIAALPEAVAAVHGGLNMLISNAGVALVGPFNDYGEADFEWLMNINFWAGVHLSRAFMPWLAKAPVAQIVYVSSVYGMIGVPGNVAYCASKFAIRGFAEALRQEIKHTGIGVTIVHPGGVNTNIARTAKIAAGTNPVIAQKGLAQFQKLLRTRPESAAKTIIKGIQRRQHRILIGTDAYVIDGLKRLMPVQSEKLMARVAGKMQPSLTRSG
ncbi:MAG TPA: SDR family NAD(P)-dependent oxidoreductase [Acidocella sp.]|nr:SDR family NAD(P)-dependent oxidoreductase [Acidocella sp.]HQT38129.1 SDR family NAD(P)-dependent oxidoreductase [Acidocella sp.]